MYPKHSLKAKTKTVNRKTILTRIISAQIFLLISGGLSLETIASQKYWLIIGSYRQGPGGRPEVSGITSPSIYAIPIGSQELCEDAGKKISEEIYKPVWQFDNRWTCVEGKG